MVFLFLSYYVNAQAPPNDDCSGAINLNVNTDLSCALKTSGTLSEATSSNLEASIGYTPRDDVWYSFTATASLHKISLQNIQGGNGPLITEVFSGTCGQLTSLVFNMNASTPVKNLTIGTTYYVRIFSTRPPSSTTFEICISTPPPLTNDECSTATALTINPDLSCTSKTAGHLMGATMSNIPGTGTFLTPNNDVWYSFIATAATHKMSLLDFGINDPMLSFDFFEGNCESPLAKLNVYENAYPGNTSWYLYDLVPGVTYYVRVFSFTQEPVATTFSICIQTPPSIAITNDECANAITLPVNTDESCSLKTMGTVTGATPSVENSNIPETYDDIWYTFTATSTSHRISFLNIEGTNISELGFEIMSGMCGQLESNNSSQSSIVSGLVVGSTYYVRVFHTGLRTRYVFFDLCIGTPPPPPLNDNCENATTLVVNSDTSCALKTAGTIAYATDSGEGNNTIGFPDDDVWFSFVATATSHKISLSDIEGDSANLIYEVLKGSCGGQLESLSSSNRMSSKISDLIIGNTYFIRVFSEGEAINYNTTFNICVAMMPPPPINDNCQSAINLIVNPNASCVQTVSGTLSGATDSHEGNNGIGIADDDVWYTFVATATSHKIKLLNVEGEQRDLVLEVLQGSCGGQLISVSASDQYADLISGLVVGSTYYIRVFSLEANTIGTSSFDVCVTTEQRPQNDNCANAIALTVNADQACTSKTTGTIANATSGPNNDFNLPDVWYSFIATSSYHEIKINSTDYLCKVYNYNERCEYGIEMEIFPSSEGTVIVNGLTVGDLYLIKVFTFMESIPDTFDICVGTLPSPPLNDDCSGAITLEVATSHEEGIISSTNVGATDFFHHPYPLCVTYNGGDVWFKAIIPSNGKLNIQTGNPENSTGSPFDSGLAVYSGTCDALVWEACNDNISQTEVSSKISLTDRTPGEEVYIRVWEIGNDEQKPFTISAWNNSLTTPEFKANNFKAYPNPVQNILNLSYNQIITNIKVYNALGQMIASKEINDKKGFIDLSHLSAGPYLVQINSDGISKSMTILKQ